MASHVTVQGKSVSGRGNSKCKEPQARKNLSLSRNSKVAVPEAEGMRGRERMWRRDQVT